MHPIFADHLRLLGFVGACLGVGALLAGLLSISGQGPWPQALLFALPVCAVYGFVALSSYFLCRGFADRRWPALLALYLAAPLVAGLSWLGLAVSWNSLGTLVGAAPLLALTPAAWLMLFAAGGLLYLLALLAHEVLLAVERAHQAAEAAVEARALAREAELQLLRAQVNPHFLFNCLNSISALTQFEPVAAREMTLELAQFFRATLALAERPQLPLADELALCEQYAAIEQRRFGAKLALQWQVEEAARACLVPAMSLQPLLENAIKHGIGPLAGGGSVRLAAGIAQGQLKLEVSNPIDPLAPPQAGQGLGLRNLRSRLEALHGAQARIAWQRIDRSFVVTLLLPATMPR